MSVHHRKMLRTLQLFRELDAEMPLRAIEAFLTAAEDEGVGVTEIARRLQISSASASRTVAVLSDRHWIKGKPGLGLLSATRIGRTTRVDMTPKGRALVENLTAVLEDRKGRKMPS